MLLFFSTKNFIPFCSHISFYEALEFLPLEWKNNTRWPEHLWICTKNLFIRVFCSGVGVGVGVVHPLKTFFYVGRTGGKCEHNHCSEKGYQAVTAHHVMFLRVSTIQKKSTDVWLLVLSYCWSLWLTDFLDEVRTWRAPRHAPYSFNLIMPWCHVQLGTV